MDFTFSFSDREDRTQKTLNARRLAFRVIVLAGLVAMFTTLPLLAQSQSYSDFSSISGLVVNPVEPPNPMQVNGKCAANQFGKPRPGGAFKTPNFSRDHRRLAG